MEILSPAGNIGLVNTAVDSKSNAVYGGFKKWNARNSAINFSKEEYNFIIKLLHKNNIKFYLTLNNLFLDEEIEEIVNYLKQEDLLMPDAFIVADIGLIHRLKEDFPNIEIHVSTQFGVHNVSDLKLLENLGIKRVILARETTKEELEYLRKQTNLELEIFIWGSQCLSFSGLCFFGSLINGGTGNRGKCINLCRDCYSSSKYDNGTLLYVSDMNCINLINEIDNIQSLKIEGRRRTPEEIQNVIKEIKERKTKGIDAGFLYGEDSSKNNMINNINYRINACYKSSEMKEINTYDVFAKFIDNIPIEFCNENANNSYYIYSELLSEYKINKKNYTIEIKFDNNGCMENASITNYKGENTFLKHLEKDDEKYQEFDVYKFKKNILTHSIEDINIVKIRFKKPLNKKLKISNNLLNEILNYFKNQTQKNIYRDINHEFKGIKELYIQTNNLKIIDQIIENKNVKIIYEISSTKELKNIDNIIEKYDDKIIYRLPIFNWKSENLRPYYNKLKNKEVMLTRYSQMIELKNIKLKKKYADYTVYSWNKKALDYLKQYNIEEFTANPELSIEQNKKIFEKQKVQYIIAGRPTLVYTRNCLKNILGCKECDKEITNNKKIFNKSKNLDFIISCKQDHREIYYKYPILNDYSKFELNKEAKFRLITNGMSFNEIEHFILNIKNKDYYKILKKENTWKNSYECNLIEGKD